MLSPEELFSLIDTSSVLTNTMMDILIELDTTNSTTTQAELNDMLVCLYTRIKDGEHIRNEKSGEILTEHDFTSWVNNEFTTYSANMFNNSIN